MPKLNNSELCMKDEMSPEERRDIKKEREKNKKDQDKKRAQERNQRDKMRG
jgi:hypothetical protein